MKLDPSRAAVRDAWAAVASRYEAYDVVLPGSPSFICQPQECDAYCCRTFSVSLGDREVERFERASGLQPIAFLELEDGEPIALPLAQPYLLARSDNHCAMLGDDLSCTQYEGRPDACRLFPYQVLFIDRERHRHLRPSREERAEALERMLRGDADGDVMAFLVGHTACPGFTGTTLTEADWATLARDIEAQQFGEAD